MAVGCSLWQEFFQPWQMFGELAHVVVDVVVDPKGKVAEEMLAGEKFG